MLKTKEEVDRNFYSCDSLISYSLEVENNDITENILKILERFLLNFKKTVINNKVIAEVVNELTPLDSKERLNKYYRIFKALHTLSKRDPKLLKTLKTKLNQEFFESLLNEFRVFDLKNKKNFKLINLTINGANHFKIKDCIHEKIQDKSKFPEEVIIKSDNIRISFEHLWIRPEEKITFKKKAGFTKIELLKCIYKGYKCIYNKYNLEVEGVDMGIGGQLFLETQIKKIFYSKNKNLITVKII